MCSAYEFVVNTTLYTVSSVWATSIDSQAGQSGAWQLATKCLVCFERVVLGAGVLGGREHMSGVCEPVLQLECS